MWADLIILRGASFYSIYLLASNVQLKLVWMTPTVLARWGITFVREAPPNANFLLLPKFTILSSSSSSAYARKPTSRKDIEGCCHNVCDTDSKQVCDARVRRRLRVCRPARCCHDQPYYQGHARPYECVNPANGSFLALYRNNRAHIPCYRTIRRSQGCEMRVSRDEVSNFCCYRCSTLRLGMTRKKPRLPAKAFHFHC